MSGKPRILVIAPTPPPCAGPEVATQQILDTKLLERDFQVIHLRSNVQTSNARKGNPGFMVCFRLMVLLGRAGWILFFRRPQVLYTILSQNISGFLRDACFIWCGSLWGCRVVAHFHGGNFQSFYHERRPWFQKFIRQTLSRISAVIVLADRLRDEFKNLLPIERLQVAYNGVPLPAETSKKSQGQLKVLFLSSISVSKGAHLLIESARQVYEYAPIQFILAGEQWPREHNISKDAHGNLLQAYDFASAKTPSSVLLLPPVEGLDKERLFQEADVFVLPSYSEGFPLSVLEAMAYGLPLIVTPVGALSEVLKEGENCLFVQPGSIQDLVKALNKILSDPALRKRMGETNRRLVEDRFTIDKTATTLTDILRSKIIEER